MQNIFNDPYPWVAVIGILSAATLIGMVIVSEVEVDPDLKVCVEAGGSYIDMSSGKSLCIMGTVVQQ